MIGVIEQSQQLVFECSNMADSLESSLAYYKNSYGCKDLFIVDTADRVKAVISSKDRFLWNPESIINISQKYYLYGGTFRDMTYERDMPLPNKDSNMWEIAFVPFYLKNIHYPESLAL